MAGSTKKKSAKKKTSSNGAGFLGSEAAALIAFAVCAFLFLSNFHICGFIGDFLSQIMLGVFGMIGYVAPVLVFIGLVFLASNRGNIRATYKLLAVEFLLIVLCGLAQMLFGGGYTEGQTIADIYATAGESGLGGGVIGGGLVYILHNAVGSTGTYLILIVCAIICIVCITERSFINAVRSGGDKAYRYAKDDYDRRKEIRVEKREEKKQLREAQRVQGVNLASTDLSRDSSERSRVADGIIDIDIPEDDMPDNVINLRDRADIFTGRIEMPGSGTVSEDEEDVVPFDEDEILFKNQVDDGVFVSRDTETFDDMGVFPERNTADTSSVMPAAAAPQQGPRKVVTATGKVIEAGGEDIINAANKREKENAAVAKAEQEAADKEVETEIEKKIKKPKKPYVFPPMNLLSKGEGHAAKQSKKELEETAVKLQQVLRNFGVGVTVTNVTCGPTVTRYEIQPEQGVKVSRIQSLADDIKLNLAATDIRIEAPIPGKAAVGIEVPNKTNSTVYLREILESEEFKKSTSKLTFAVGKDIGGQVIVADLAKMPHLLIAGQTGSGKSVGINTIIMSFIYHATPDEVKLILIDPKVVELSAYNGIPHLLIPVVTDPKKAAGALNWAVAEMMDRYNKFAEANVRDIKGYNARVKTIADEGVVPEDELPQKLPQIVIIIDELSDLMMVASNEVEDAIVRLAQLARAAGIHLIIATQRPSADVITGIIKANIPSRIAYSVASGIDSRIILDMTGAETLLGNGDMLFYPSGYPKPVRVQGAFISDSDVSKVVDFLKDRNDEAEYDETLETQVTQTTLPGTGGAANGRDELFADAGRFIIEKDRASIGNLQRMFKIGFNRAARIMDQLADAGVVGEEEGTKPRKILMSMEEFENMLEQGM